MNEKQKTTTYRFRDKLTGEEWFVKVEDTGIKPVKLQGLDNTYLVPDHIVVTVEK
jgi:hypothetical protein